MKSFFLLLLGACGSSTSLRAGLSAQAAPIPVMLGPIRCMGTCGPAPVPQKYTSDVFASLASHEVRGQTSTTSTTVTTTTTTTDARAGDGIFASPLLDPLFALPWSPRCVIQLEGLDIGKLSTATGVGTDNRSNRLELVAISRGYHYLLPKAPTPVPVLAPPAPVKVKKKGQR